MSSNTKLILQFTFILFVLCGQNINTASVGIESGMKVFNGSTAFGHPYLKYVVRIYVAYINCGGAILTPKIILTAGHCITFDQIDPHITKEDITQSYICAGSLPNNCSLSRTGQKIKVQKAIVHRNYTKAFGGYDIAILILRDALVEDGMSVQRIKLPDRTPTVGAVCTFIGWGDVTCGKYDYLYPDEAQYTTQTIMSSAACKKVWWFFKSGMLCANNSKSLICPGDSGSPLICDGRVVGLASLSAYNPEHPVTYTDVLYHRNWIEHIIAQNFATRWSTYGLLVFFSSLLLNFFL